MPDTPIAATALPPRSKMLAATQRTPAPHSSSSMANPRVRIFCNSRFSASLDAIVRGVRRVSGLDRNSSSNCAGARYARRALPSAVQCASMRRPTHVFILTSPLDSTLSTYTTCSRSSTARCAVKPVWCSRVTSSGCACSRISVSPFPELARSKIFRPRL